MARPKKAESKDIAPVTTITVEEFLQTRNTVVAGLGTLQSAISDLSRSYLTHTENLIGRTPGTTAHIAFTNPLGVENGGFFNARGFTPAPVIEGQQVQGQQPEAKKRKRAPHDKNAPKRALTPFFLYLQTARPQIADEMGPGHTAKEVQDEGGRRWREMPDNEKEKWTELYGINFARYKEHTKAYKAGLPIPDISDAEARRLYEQNKQTGQVPNTTQLETSHAPEEDSDSSSDTSSEESSPEPAPAPPAKKQKGGKESKKKQAAVAEPEQLLDPALMNPTPIAPAPPTRDKKTSKKAKAEAAAAEAKQAVAEAVSSPPKTGEKQKKKKRKSTAGVDA